MQNDEVSRVRTHYEKKIKLLEQEHNWTLVVIGIIIASTVLGLIIAF